MAIWKWIKQHPYWFLLVLTFIVYGNTLLNEYALDDAIVITQNKFVKQGINGIDDIFTTESFTGFFGFDKKLVTGGRYRPLSIATFALEHALWGKQPLLSHLVNLLLYGFVIMLIFRILQKNDRLANSAALIITVIYALHPIHTEAVANVKGRDEILAFVFVLLAAWWLLYSREKMKLVYPAAGIMLLLAMLSKEHAIAFVVLIPLAMFYLHYSHSRILKSFVALFIPALVFIFIRYQVLGGMQITESGSLMNNPFVNMATDEKYATILLTWLWYLRLLIFPHPLTYDYYPYHVPVTDFTSVYPWLSILVVAGLLYVAVRSLRNRKIYGYWIWFFIGTFILMSNLFFPIGTFMNERFMFMPSLAFTAGLGYGIYSIIQNRKYKFLGYALLTIIGLGYAAKAIDRNFDWKNDFTLFTHDVKISENSAKGNCVAGGQYYERAQQIKDKQKKNTYLQKASNYLQKSLSIYPTYNDAHLLYGNTKFGLDQPLDSVMPHYLSILSRAPHHQNAWKNALIVAKKGKPLNRLKWYKKLEQIDKRSRFEINYHMGKIYGRHLKQYDKAEKYLKKAIKSKPKSIRALKDIAVVYGITKRYEASVKPLRKVVKLKPGDAGAWFNLGLSLNALNRLKEAQAAFDKAHELNPEKKRVVVRRKK